MRIPLIAVFLILIFFFRQIVASEVWYCCDNLLINIPARVYQKEVIFPVTNPYIFSGTPFLADINLATFYPGNILFWIFENPFRALTIAIIVHFIVAFTGMYMLTKNIVSAIVFTFSGTLVTYTNNLPMLQVASLLPWVFWAWSNNLTLFVIIASVQIFAGHAQFMYYTWLVLIVWTLWFRPKNIWRRLIAALVVALVTSVQVVPFLQFARLSTRPTFGYEYAVFDSLNPLAIIRLLVPWSVGILNQGTAWAMGGSVYGYVGVLPLILVLVASRRNPVVRFFLVVAATSFFLALGKYNPLYPFLYKFVPGLGSFRSPQHFLLLWTFAIAILSGYGSQQLVRSKKLLVTTGAVMLIVAVFLFVIFGTHLFDSLFPAKLISKFALDPSLRPTIMRFIVLNAGLNAIVVSIFYKFRKRFVLCSLIFVDLLIFTRSNIITLPESIVTSWFDRSDVLAKKITGVVWVHKELYPAPSKKQFGKFDWPDEAAWQVAILRPNINMLYHIPSIDGYASIVSKKYQDSFGVTATDPTGVNLGEITGEKLLSRSVHTVFALPDPKYIQELYPLLLSQWSPQMAIYREARK